MSSRGYVPPQNTVVKKDTNISPAVAALLNRAASSRTLVRIVLDTDVNDPADINKFRLTVVVDKDGNLVRKFYG